jgi:hypothetical protein
MSLPHQDVAKRDEKQNTARESGSEPSARLAVGNHGDPVAATTTSARTVPLLSFVCGLRHFERDALATEAAALVIELYPRRSHHHAAALALDLSPRHHRSLRCQLGWQTSPGPSATLKQV